MKRAWIVAGAVAVAATIGSSAIAAEDAATKKKIEELEKRQESLSEELRRLRQEVEQPKPDAKVEEVERRQGIMTDELRRLRDALVLPEHAELKSYYGLGPAASKVYGLQQGLSIGGYGEANFKDVVKDRGDTPAARAANRDEFDLARFVLYVGYKFNDWIVMNSEIEFEHAGVTETSSGGSEDGEASVEFMTLDFLLHPKFNLRAGLVLMPVGFINEMHEPPFFHGNERPEVERFLIPSTWRANGIGFFGELLPGLTYRTYGVSSLNAKAIVSDGLDDARQNGSFERAHDFSWVGRVDYSFLPSSLVGGSAYLGDQGQGQTFAGKQAGVFMQMYEAHAQLRTHGLELRALGAIADIDDADLLSADPDIDQTIARTMLGYYGEAAYDVMPLLLPNTTQYLAPWLRYSRLDTQNRVPRGFASDETADRDSYQIGIDYKPIPQVVLKADYSIQDAKQGNRPDELRLGGGFVF